MDRDPISLMADFPELFERPYCGVGFGPGWYKLLHELCTMLTLQYPAVRVAQVKEKFGGLRFYVDNAPGEALELISVFEALSFKTCEQCGEPGKPRSGGWIKTLCAGCAKGE